MSYGSVQSVLQILLVLLYTYTEVDRHRLTLLLIKSVDLSVDLSADLGLIRERSLFYPLLIPQIIILTNSCIHLIIFAGGITIYLMSREGSTPGGARASISRGPGFYFYFS